MALGFMSPSQAAAAPTQISFDNYANGGYQFGVTSYSWTHVTGANADRILWVGAESATGTSSVTASYDSNAMTMVGSPLLASSHNVYIYLFYLINPTPGSHTVQLNQPTSQLLSGSSCSYSGAQQSGVPDASNTGVYTTSSLNIDVTTVANNCWYVFHVGNCSSGNFTGTARTTGESNSSYLGDSNGSVGAGGTVAGITIQAGEAIVASFAPV